LNPPPTVICFNPRSHVGSDSNFSQKFITIFSRNQQIIILHTLFSPFSSPLFSTLHFICAHFRVRITRHFHVCFLFALLYYHKINVSSTAIPRSTPICSTFVLYLFPR